MSTKRICAMLFVGLCWSAPDVYAGISCNTEGDPCPDGTAAVCNDGRFCNGVETCENGQCACAMPTTVPDCNDQLDCTFDFCSAPLNGCVHDTNFDLGCLSDGPCNGVERCDPTADPNTNPTGCVTGPAIVCNDDVDCTPNSCVDTGPTSDACFFKQDAASCCVL